MDCIKVVFGFKGFIPLFRQQNDSDLDRQHRMKSKPLNLHISVDLTIKDVIIIICSSKQQIRKKNSDLHLIAKNVLQV